MVKGRPYIYRHKAKGRTYFYFQRGKQGERIRLPDDPNSEEFDKAYWTARRGHRDEKPSKSTLEAVALNYLSSSKWDRLSERTQRDYREKIEYLRTKAGEKDVAWFTRPRVIEMVERNKHRPRFANYVRQVLSILMEHAIDLGFRKDNPAKKVHSLAMGEGWAPWPARAIEAYREKADGLALLIFEMCLGTGQRIGDVLKMRWDEIEDDGIMVTQGKSQRKGAREDAIWVPFTPRLSSLLAGMPPQGLWIISGKDTRQLSYRSATHAVERVRAASGTKGYVLHGLRANRASELYEMGCTDAEVQAITGHKSVEMARKYGRGARQRLLAENAILRGKT